MSAAWTDDEHTERFDRLSSERQSMVLRYVKRFIRHEKARQKKRDAGRALTADEERVGELMALEEIVRRSKS